MNLRIRNPILAPSILSSDYMRLADVLAMLNRAKRCSVHVDVMDGVFVPNITVGLPVVAAIRNETSIPLDCHLMITNPYRYAVDFVKAGANWVSIHQEADCHCHRTLNAIRTAGAKAGIALNPGTPVETITDLIGTFDFVVLMSVNPGFGGQSFIPNTIEKIKRLDRIRTKKNIPFMIQVDGGVTISNASTIVTAGADILVAGSTVFKSEDQIDTISKLISEMDKGKLIKN